MKFTFQSVGLKGARLGFVSEVGRHDRVFETPLCFLTTNSGCIPHLTNDTMSSKLGGIYHPPMPVVMPLPGLARMQESIDKFGKGIGQFVRLQDHLLYTSVQDPAVETPSGYHDKLGISLWYKKGRFQLDADKFMDIQKAFIPDIYQALCDSDTSKDSSKKRIRKSVDRSLELLDICIKKHEELPELKETAVFGTVQGGYDSEMRMRSAKQTADRPVAGFVIDGFHNYGPKTEQLCFEEIRCILEETLSHLPQNKTRLMHGIWRPDNLIKAIESGIDLFDASYPYVLTERQCAFVLPLTNFLPATKQSEVSTSENTTGDHPSNYELVLGDKRYSDDFSPIAADCTCYTCQRFTRAYINHLITTSEMLAQVLLTIHNLHHYFLLFDAIRLAMKNDSLQKLKDHVLSFAQF